MVMQGVEMVDEVLSELDRHSPVQGSEFREMSKVLETSSSGYGVVSAGILLQALHA